MEIESYSMIRFRIVLKVVVVVTQSCPTLCDPMDCGLPGSSVRGTFQARILEWGAISFSRELSKLIKVYT